VRSGSVSPVGARSCRREELHHLIADPLDGIRVDHHFVMRAVDLEPSHLARNVRTPLLSNRILDVVAGDQKQVAVDHADPVFMAADPACTAPGACTQNRRQTPRERRRAAACHQSGESGLPHPPSSLTSTRNSPSGSSKGFTAGPSSSRQTRRCHGSVTPLPLNSAIRHLQPGASAHRRGRFRFVKQFTSCGPIRTSRVRTAAAARAQSGPLIPNGSVVPHQAAMSPNGRRAVLNASRTP
jgi:hypothetical protein